MRTLVVLALAVLGVCGCVYPPHAPPVREEGNRAVIEVPYDLTWDAVQLVVKKNDYRLEAGDSDHGIVEAEAHSFTLDEANCGEIRSIAGRYDVEPGSGSTAVYRFRVEPSGPQASSVAIHATFSTPLRAPFQPPRDLVCVSRGAAEKRLLKEVESIAREQRRPAAKPSQVEQSEQAGPSPLAPGRPTLLRPELPEMKVR